MQNSLQLIWCSGMFPVVFFSEFGGAQSGEEGATDLDLI